MKATGEQEREIWDFVQRLNRTWTVERNPQGLQEFFHQGMVAVAPSSKGIIEGRKACVAAWKEFADAARIRKWSESGPIIEVYNEGRTAIVTYHYHITYQMGGQSDTAHGRDMICLVKEDGRWWAIADQFQQ